MSDKMAAALGGDQMTTLVRKQFALYMQVPEEMLYGVELQAMQQHLSHDIAIRLAKQVYGEQLKPNTVTVKESMPSTWFQHWRLEHAQSWWLRWHIRRWPIRTLPITLTATWENYVMYPWGQLASRVPDYLGDPVRHTLPAMVQVVRPPSFEELRRYGV